MENFKKRIGRNVATLRKEKGWTQEILAEIVNMALNSISFIELGKAWMEYDTVIKLAKAFDVPEERLFVDPEHRIKPTIPEALAAINQELGFMPPRPRRIPKKRAL